MLSSSLADGRRPAHEPARELDSVMEFDLYTPLPLTSDLIAISKFLVFLKSKNVLKVLPPA